MSPAAADQLAQSPVFSALPQAELENLAAMMVRRPYKRGQVVFHQADPGTSVHLIESGRVKVVVAAEAGEELLLRVLSVGEIFGELALFDHRPRSATVVALEPTVTQVLERDVFLDFLRRHPDAALHLCSALATLIRRLTDQVEDLALLDVPQRLERKLRELAEMHGRPDPDGIRIDLPITQSDLASSIGTSRVSVNHYLSSLERRGIISRAGHRIVVRRLGALR
jgi:CRP/FNR family transcriptional regulator, cyclic AMP receptor protein